MNTFIYVLMLLTLSKIYIRCSRGSDTIKFVSNLYPEIQETTLIITAKLTNLREILHNNLHNGTKNCRFHAVVKIG